MRNYFVSMAIRTICFVLAIFLHGWPRWVCVALAVVLPYIAVVFANAVQRRRIDVLGSVIPPDHQYRLGPSDQHTNHGL